MDTVLRRVRLGKADIEDLVTRVSNGESLAIIGPQYSGKSWLVSRLLAILQNSGLTLLHLRFSTAVAEPEELAMSRISRQLQSSERIRSLPELFTYLQRLARKLGRPLTLFLSDIDGLEREAVRRLLGYLRSGVYGTPRWLTPILTGESDLHALVAGPQSEFNCSHELILQGMDMHLFGSELEQWCERHNVEMQAPARTAFLLWRATGGNLSLGRQILHSIVDYQIDRNVRPVTLGLADLREAFKSQTSLGLYGAPYFQRVGELIASSPQVWPSLQDLLGSKTVLMHGPTPGILELSGIASWRAGNLEISSPLMKRYLRNYLGSRRRGDLEALAGNFEIAFDSYRKAGLLSRPANYEDELMVGAVIRRLMAVFRQTDFDRLNLLLRSALQLILGFQHIATLEFDPASGRYIAAEADAVPVEFKSEFDRVKQNVGGIHRIVKENETYGFIITTGTDGRTLYASHAIMVWDPPHGKSINPPRLALLEDLLRSFSDSHRAVHQAYVNRQVERLQARMHQAATEVVSSLFIELTEPADVLSASARTLLSGEPALFGLVTFVLVEGDGAGARVWHSNPEIKDDAVNFPTIEALCKESSVNVTNADLIFTDGPATDATCFVAKVPINKQMYGFLLLRGTDGFRPSLELIDPVETFVGHLGAALENSRRVALLSSALNRISDPLLLFDSEGRHVYANDPAKTLFGPELGKLSGEWREPSWLDSERHQDLIGFVEVARKERHRVASFVERIDERPYQGIVVSDTLLSKRGELAGVLVHIPDQQYYLEMVHALQILEEAPDEDSALLRLAEIFRKQGHAWIRVYLVEGNRLLPHKAIDDRPEVLSEFSKVDLPRSEMGGPSWSSLDGQPHVFYFSESDDGRIFYTPKGVKATRVTSPPERARLGKKPGDYWIEFPLLRAGVVIGNLCIACDESLSPERLEMMRVFAAIAGNALQSVRGRKPANQKAIARAVALTQQRALARLSALSPVLVAFEHAAQSFPEARDELTLFRSRLEAIYMEIRNGIAGGNSQ